jgi:hypothetical protein
MAQIQTRNNIQGWGELNCLLQSPVDNYIPSSPDPTPLRMLAFSVAESALQADPNSPMFGSLQSMPAHDPWGKTTTSRWSVEPKVSLASRRGQSKPMWDVIDKARERREKREKECEYHQSMPKTPANLAASPSTVDSSLPTSPVSPTDYNFVLPTGSHLVASLGPGAAPSKHGLQMPAASPTKQYFPQFTQSAEPSPIKSTFEGLDQTRPPPVFVPRLSAKAFADVPAPAKSPSQLLKSQASPAARVNYPSRAAKLPSLAQIQKKMGNGHRRNGSAGTMPRPTRSDSESSIELKTPDEELEGLNLVITRQRSASPPVESRLPQFLRQRKVQAPRPLSMPSMDYQLGCTEKPYVMITPPSATPSVPPPSARSATPTRRAFTTPPTRYGANVGGSPIRPISPTHSIPIITCTPAQEDDSASETESEGDVVVFDGMAEELQEMQEKMERERRGQAMKDKLLSRRRSLQ